MIKPQVYGYLRVSTEKQTVSNFKAEILLYADEKKLGQVEWIQETVSGRVDWKKRELGKHFFKMNKGDTIIMSEYSRIGRDFLQSIEFLAECRRNGINVYSTIGDIPINNDANSNLLLSMRAWQAQIERENTAYRTKIGIAKRKADGQVFGRKKEMILEKDLETNKAIVKKLIEDGVKYKFIAEKLDCTTVTLWKFVKKHNLK